MLVVGNVRRIDAPRMNSITNDEYIETRVYKPLCVEAWYQHLTIVSRVFKRHQ